mgnify:CR=1 FL=1
MAINMKVLRIENFGLIGQTAFVGLQNDSPVGFRIATITGIPPGLTPGQSKDWILTQYTKQQLWDLPLSRDVNGREKQVWLLMWYSGDTLNTIQADKDEANTDRDAIDPDIDEINTDIANVETSTLAQLQLIVKRTMQHQKRILQREKKVLQREKRNADSVMQLLKVAERLARELWPVGIEAQGE